MRAVWIDAGAGVAGDMLLGALTDAGAPPEALQTAVDAVIPGTVRLRAEAVTRAGLRATRVHVELLGADQPHRSWATIRALLDAASLRDAVRERALAVFTRLAEAEARVHGVSVDEVHFHEVGAWDSIADVVGVCAALDALGVERVTAGQVAVGAGRARTAHGDLPVPVPAVAELAVGWRVCAGGQGELATPTGMALITALAQACEDLPPLDLQAVGVGAGGRDTPARPNVVRVLLGAVPERDRRTGSAGVGAGGGIAGGHGESGRVEHGPAAGDHARGGTFGSGDAVGGSAERGHAELGPVEPGPDADGPAPGAAFGFGDAVGGSAEGGVVQGGSAGPVSATGGSGAGTGRDTGDPGDALVLEANVDDLDPRVWPGVLAALLDAGASDAWLTPVLMKKGRPAHTLSVLARPDRADALRGVVLRETSTLGVREYRVRKTALERGWAEVEVDGGRLPVKVGHEDGVIVQVTPEFDHAARLAARSGLPVRTVLASAEHAAAARGLVPGGPVPAELGAGPDTARG